MQDSRELRRELVRKHQLKGPTSALYDSYSISSRIRTRSCVYYCSGIDSGFGVEQAGHYLLDTVTGRTYSLPTTSMPYLFTQLRQSWAKWSNSGVGGAQLRQMVIDMNRAMQDEPRRQLTVTYKNTPDLHSGKVVHSGLCVSGTNTSFMTFQTVVILIERMFHIPVWRRVDSYGEWEKACRKMLDRCSPDTIALSRYHYDPWFSDVFISMPITGHGKSIKGIGSNYGYFEGIRVIWGNAPRSKIYIGLGYHPPGVPNLWIPYLDAQFSRHASVNHMGKKLHDRFTWTAMRKSLAKRSAAVRAKMGGFGKTMEYNDVAHRRLMTTLDSKWPATIRLYRTGQPSVVTKETMAEASVSAYWQAIRDRNYGRVSRDKSISQARIDSLLLGTKLLEYPLEDFRKGQYTIKQYEATKKRRKKDDWWLHSRYSLLDRAR